MQKDRQGIEYSRTFASDWGIRGQWAMMDLKGFYRSVLGQAMLRI